MSLIHVTPAKIVSEAIAADRNLDRGSISFTLRANVRNRPVTTQGIVDYVRDTSATVRLIEKSPEHQSDRAYRVRGKQFSAYDFYSDEAIRRWVPQGFTLTKRLEFVLGPMPDPVKVATDPNWVAGFLHSLPNLNKYTVASSKSGQVLNYRAPHGNSTITIRFNQRGLLSAFTSTNKGSTFAWTVSYSKQPRPIQFLSGGVQVKVFSDHEPPPKFATQSAREICLAASRAFRKLQTSKVVVKRPDKRVVVYWDRGKVRQNAAGNTWAYDGKILDVAVRGNFYRGKANHADALDYLAFLANGEDSLARSFLLRSNLLDSFFSPADTVRIKGTMTVVGVPSTVVEISGPGSRSSLVIRNADHLIASTQTDTFGTDRKVAFHDECMYQYMPFSPSSNLFTLHPGSKAQPKPLPKSAIRMGSKYVHPELQYEYRNR